MSRSTLILLLLLGLPGVMLAQSPAAAPIPAEEDPAKTEVYTPVPPLVPPGKTMADPPADAIVLLNADIGLAQWRTEKDSAAPWLVKKGIATVKGGSGNIYTRQAFGSVQLHLEFATPAKVEGTGQGRGNSGVFLMDRYEVQILDNFNNMTYSNGQAGSIYKQHIPLANACRPPGEWQTYDIFFTAPVFGADSLVRRPAYITLVHNGVLVQDHAEVQGTTVYRGAPYYTRHGLAPIRLQDHGNPVRFRNIWVRPLEERP